MATLDPAVEAAALADLDRARLVVNTGVCASTDSATANHWGRWRTFCIGMAIDPLLSQLEDPIALLQIFAIRYRSGEIAPSGGKVRARTVEGAIRAIGQTLASVGAPDPRYNLSHKIDFRLQRMWSSYTRDDPPPKRVKPIPISGIRHVIGIAYASHVASVLAIAHMVVLAFFFLLRPGEYTSGSKSSDTTPFTQDDVQLFIGHRRLCLITTSDARLRRATFGTLEFTNQKNGVRGEVIGLGRSGSQTLCPVYVLVERVIHLRTHNAPAATPLSSYFANGKWKPVRPSDITLILKNAVAVLGASLGFTKEDITARALRASGAMALLCANVDHDRIQLVGRWKSDAMLRYLHVQAQPVMQHFAKAMVTDGEFSLIPNRAVVQPTVPLH